ENQAYVQHTNEENNDELMSIRLDRAKECRDLALIRMMAQKQRIEKYYNRRTKHRFFQEGDLVLQNLTENTGDKNSCKLGLN
ncbi:hypothetical protein HAX54_004879, partial [Datura stramonium]|nr:hypothetical protein [Datura stramonium]